MNPFPEATRRQPLVHKTALLLIVTAIFSALTCRTEAAPNIVLWDTGSHFGETVNASGRADWKPVPTDLFALEANPPKASSDPGYYGREYAFKGDAVVENGSVSAVFWSAKGRVALYSKTNAAQGAKSLGQIIAEISPLESNSQTIDHCTIVRNAGDEVILEVFFSGGDSSDRSTVFSFGKNEIVEIKPSPKTKGLNLLSPIEYGVVPSFIGDDLVFGPTENAASDALFLPSENLFLGLLKGEATTLVMTWPKANQQMRLNLAREQDGKRPIQSIAFETDAQPLYLAVLQAPGIWHKEELNSSFLEKDVPIKWKKPFPAKWETQLSEAGIKTRFAFREAKAEIWRGVPGSYNYPVWFDGDTAFYHLSKKVPPKGESLVYFLEGQDTPVSISTPVDILNATLGRQVSDSILDVSGRKMRTHHRRGGSGVRRACTCGCTEAIQAIFEEGSEVEKKSDIDEAIGDMIYFVQHHVDRIDEYHRTAQEMIKFLDASAISSPDLKPFIDNLRQVAEQIPQEYNVQKENMKSPKYADELAQKTLALTDHKDKQNLPAYMELLKDWRAMGGAQDYVLAQCHAVTRKLFQEAGYGCTSQANAVKLAQEVRQRCRQVLRNPDGYEIWPNY